jgi:hypothetical protein
MSDNASSGMVPARLNASDFTLYNATPVNVAKFQMALDYIQNTDPVGTAMIKQMWLEGGRVALNNFEAPSPEVLATMSPEMQKAYDDYQGNDMWVPEIHAVMWNPDSALQVYDSNKQIIGIQSAATAFVHESGHAIDPMSIVHAIYDRLPGSGYGNLGEWLAGQYEMMSSQNLGEVIRTNHGGYDVRVENPTVHTGVDAFGDPVWMQRNEYGVLEYGPRYDFHKIDPLKGVVDQSLPDPPGNAPRFGSTETGNPGPITPNPTGSPDDVSPRHDEGGDPVGHDQGGQYGDGDDSGDHNLPDGSSGGDYQGDPGATGAGDNDDPDHMPSPGGNGDYPGNEHDNDPDPNSDEGGDIGSGIDYGPVPDGSGPEGGRNRDVNAANLHTQPKPGGDASAVAHQYSDAGVRTALAHAISNNFTVDNHQIQPSRTGEAVFAGEVVPAVVSDEILMVVAAHLPLHYGDASLVGVPPPPIVDGMSFA